MPKTVAIIQARLSSKRLPNKVLMEVVLGISMLEMVVRKASLATLVDQVVVTTPDLRICQLIRAFCGNTSVYWHSGKRDVIMEYTQASDYHNLQNIDIIVRLTADCPLLRPQEIDKCIQAFLDNEVDLVYNTDEKANKCYAEGSDVEVFSRMALEWAHNEAKTSEEREHPTLFMRRNMKTLYVEPERDFGFTSVDTRNDYERVCEISRRGKR